MSSSKTRGTLTFQLHWKTGLVFDPLLYDIQILVLYVHTESKPIFWLFDKAVWAPSLLRLACSRPWLRLWGRGKIKKMWAGKRARGRVGIGSLVSPSLKFFSLALWLRAILNYLNAWNVLEINKTPRGLIENYGMQYISGWWSQLRHVVWRHSAFVFCGHFIIKK